MVTCCSLMRMTDTITTCSRSAPLWRLLRRKLTASDEMLHRHILTKSARDESICLDYIYPLQWHHTSYNVNNNEYEWQEYINFLLRGHWSRITFSAQSNFQFLRKPDSECSQAPGKVDALLQERFWDSCLRPYCAWSNCDCLFMSLLLNCLTCREAQIRLGCKACHRHRAPGGKECCKENMFMDEMRIRVF